MAANKTATDITIQLYLVKSSGSGKHFELDVQMQLPGQGITAIFGVSGSGKTTLLRAIAGLETQVTGHISINDTTYLSDNQCLPPHKRNIGYVFQEPALFPHLTAEQNIQYAVRRTPKCLQSDKYAELLRVLGIEHLLKHYPEQLSGGEKQRVAIARALASNPALLLMDEPLSALDDARKTELLTYLEQLQALLAIPILYVSHSRQEIARLAEQVVVLQNGKVHKQGHISEVFQLLQAPEAEQPCSVVQGQVVEHDAKYGLSKVQVGSSALWLATTSDLKLLRQVRICIAAKDVSISLTEHSQCSIINRLPVQIVAITATQITGVVLLELQHQCCTLFASVTTKSVDSLNLHPGLSVWAQIKSTAILR